MKGCENSEELHRKRRRKRSGRRGGRKKRCSWRQWRYCLGACAGCGDEDEATAWKRVAFWSIDASQQAGSQREWGMKRGQAASMELEKKPRGTESVQAEMSCNHRPERDWGENYRGCNW